MNIAQHDWVRRSFSRIGAGVRFEASTRLSDRFSVNVERTDRVERFMIRWSEDVEYVVADVQPKLRHLLLMVKDPEVKEIANAKILCGHDERHLFVASIPESAAATSVKSAMTALKPKELLEIESQLGIKPRHLHSRRRKLNNGEKIFRQGEFMFVPRPDFEPAEPLGITRNEILTRAAMRASRWGSTGGNPHIAWEAYRQKGTRVHFHQKYPAGLTDEEYGVLLKRIPSARSLVWRIGYRDPELFVRGTIRHPEHATIDLGRVWHRVYVNTESLSHAMRHVAYID